MDEALHLEDEVLPQEGLGVEVDSNSNEVVAEEVDRMGEVEADLSRRVVPVQSMEDLAFHMVWFPPFYLDRQVS
jgi:hypothetical protein